MSSETDSIPTTHSSSPSVVPVSNYDLDDFLRDLDPLVPETIVVVGAGSYGTALSQAAARQGNTVRLLVRDANQAKVINETHYNPKTLTSFQLHPNISCYTDPVEAFSGSIGFAILAIPAQQVVPWLTQHKHLIPEDLILVNTAKGLCLAENCLLSEAIRRVLGRWQPFVVLSGPSFAKEIMMECPTAVVVASRRLLDAGRVRVAFSSPLFHMHLSRDVIGVELGGALKNPLAIGAGIIQGRNMGWNAIAAYVTRSGEELQALCKALGGDPLTIAGLAGIGDLMLTSFGELSRNRQLGIRLSQGEKLDAITKEMTVEGVPTARVAVLLARRCGLTMPIFTAVHALINGRLSMDEAHFHIMGNPM